MVGVCINVFHVTLWILQEDASGNVETINYSTPDERCKRRHVHMILYRDRNDPKGLGNHYNSVVKEKINKGRKYVDFGQDMQKVEDISHRNSLKNATTSQVYEEGQDATTSSIFMGNNENVPLL
ncbi:MAG: hypothetical protein MJE68_16885 [Proteobacteria bacterium]|nr:hypothetical protein [Pseudomonadota bacterium]